MLKETQSWVSKVLLFLCVGKSLDLDYVEDIGILSMSIGCIEVRALEVEGFFIWFS